MPPTPRTDAEGLEPILAGVISTEPAPGFRTIGQAHARAIAQHAAASGRLQRTLLIHGPSGAGKDSFVDDLLALAFCTDADPARRPCNTCRGCRDGRARTHPDLVVGSPEAWRDARSAGESIVAAARRWLLDAAGAPIVAERRVVLIESADRANEQTQNALLKALEEPSRRHMFILVAGEPSRLLPTIRSRSQALRIGPVRHSELASWLVDHERIPADLADSLARIAGGLVGVAAELARHPDRVAWRRGVQAELMAALEQGRADRFALTRELLDQAARASLPPPAELDVDAEPSDSGRPAPAVQRGAALLIVDAWLALARDLLVAAAGRADLAPTVEMLPDLEARARRIGPQRIAAAMARLERAHEALEQNAAPRLALEAAMLAWPFLGSET